MTICVSEDEKQAADFSVLIPSIHHSLFSNGVPPTAITLHPQHRHPSPESELREEPRPVPWLTDTQACV